MESESLVAGFNKCGLKVWWVWVRLIADGLKSGLWGGLEENDRVGDSEIGDMPDNIPISSTAALEDVLGMVS